MTDKIEALKEKAIAATPGPWFVSGVRFRMNMTDWHSVNRYNETLKRDDNIACVGFDTRSGDGLNDAAYIAAASPDVILSLLSELDRLRSSNEANGWQPIETAPKDRLIDIWTVGYGAEPHRVSDCYHDRICDEWRTSRPAGHLMCIKAKYVTHWRSIPASPAVGSQS